MKISKQYWVDAMKCQILHQNKALHELILWIKTIENEEDIDHEIVSLLRHLHHVTQNCANLNNNDQIFLGLQTIIYFTVIKTMIIYPFQFIQVSNLPCGQNLF